MRFDDRLATVLDQPADDPHARAVQWRQLVELFARNGSIGSGKPVRDEAFEQIARLMEDIPPGVVEATARAIAGPGVPPELIALFATRGASASAALLAAADLDEGDRRVIEAVAAPDVRPLLAALGGEVEDVDPARPRPRPRSLQPPARQDTALPEGMFRWECGPDGVIDWVEHAPRAALIGRSLAEAFPETFAARLPFADRPSDLAESGPLSGDWQWSGAPTFHADSGRFAGYRGIARRQGAAPDASAEQAEPAADDLRELIHELRTPLNAIIGFGEIIEGQYLGPAHRAYRDRASAIVADARRLAEAVDNLDLSAKWRSGRYEGEATTESRALLSPLEGLRAEAGARGIVLDIENRNGVCRVALPAALTERLATRFIQAVMEQGTPGEELTVRIDKTETHLALSIGLPLALRGRSEEGLIGDRADASTSFGLRLANRSAAMVGAGLSIGDDRATLNLPLARS